MASQQQSGAGAQATVDDPGALELSAGPWGAGWDYWDGDTQARKQIIQAAETLERDEWETLSDRMVQTYQERLVGIQDLRDAGLTRNISLATQVDLWQTMSEMTEAEISMDGETRSEEDRSVYDTDGVPVPIVHKDFRVRDRDLQTSRRLGNDLRTDNVAGATRVVTELLERLLFEGWGPNVATHRGDDYELYGYTTFPDREQYSGSDWGTAGNIRDDFVGMLDRLDENDRTPGRRGFWTYIAPPQWRQLRSTIDPDGTGDTTVRDRLETEFGAELGQIRRAPMLDDGEAVMVDPSPDTVELAEAEDIQTVNWTSGSGMTHHYKVLAAVAPEIKSDQTGNSGIVHATGI